MPNLRSREKVFDLLKTVLYQASKLPGISFWRALECRHMEEYDEISLDDVRHTIAILSNLQLEWR